MVQRIYTKKEAAGVLQVSPRQIDEFIFAGKLRYTRIGRRKFFTETHLNEFLLIGDG